MELLVIIFILSPMLVVGKNVPNVDLNPKFDKTVAAENKNDSDKDMYVIHATVYQIGIITNKTDVTNETDLVGDQESVTFYHSNGSTIDLGGIPAPLLTNVTAQTLVGVAPATVQHDSSKSQLRWNDIKDMANSQQYILGDSEESLFPPKGDKARHSRNADYDQSDSEADNREYSDNVYSYMKRLTKRSLDPKEQKQSEDYKTPVKIISGSAVVPQSAGLNYIGIPPLITLNNNFSEIPVPIPNTSVIHYAKVNTLVHSTP